MITLTVFYATVKSYCIYNSILEYNKTEKASLHTDETRLVMD